MEIRNFRKFYITTNNKLRRIVTYKETNNIREYHQYINNNISKDFTPSLFTSGYVKDKSIFHNVLPHLQNDYFYKTDIKNFFNNINHSKLRKMIYKEVKSIKKPADAYKIVKDCSIGTKGLPLGFITSPTLSNIYLKNFDISLYSKLKSLNIDNVIYTRYADDIMISFKCCSNKGVDDIFNNINKVVSCELRKVNLKNNCKKTKKYSFASNGHVKFTGISIVNKSGKRMISVGRNNKRKLFYDAYNYKKKNMNNQILKSQLKGRLSYYLSIEKVGFENFVSNGMRKQLNELNYNSIIELINDL